MAFDILVANTTWMAKIETTLEQCIIASATMREGHMWQANNTVGKGGRYELDQTIVKQRLEGNAKSGMLNASDEVIRV